MKPVPSWERGFEVTGTALLIGMRLGTNPSLPIRDRDGVYGEIFIRRVRSFGIRDRPTSPRSPWQNAYAERLIGSIRRECTDLIVIFGERHLRHVLLSYTGYYNGTRTHLSLSKDAPISRAAERSGQIVLDEFVPRRHDIAHQRRAERVFGPCSERSETPAVSTSPLLLENSLVTGGQPDACSTPLSRCWSVFTVTNFNDFNGPGQTTNLGVRSSNLFGRAILPEHAAVPEATRVLLGSA
jgi:hypothetical protein